MFERAKTVHALDRAATVIGSTIVSSAAFINLWSAMMGEVVRKQT
jgi:hypothetical protein